MQASLYKCVHITVTAASVCLGFLIALQTCITTAKRQEIGKNTNCYENIYSDTHDIKILVHRFECLLVLSDLFLYKIVSFALVKASSCCEVFVIYFYVIYFMVKILPENKVTFYRQAFGVFT